MITKIDDFDTGEQINSNIIHIDLDPVQNIKNKKYFKNLLKKIAESSLIDLEKNLKEFYHDEAELNAFHPINEIKGIDEIIIGSATTVAIKQDSDGQIKFENEDIGLLQLSIGEGNIIGVNGNIFNVDIRVKKQNKPSSFGSGLISNISILRSFAISIL